MITDVSTQKEGAKNNCMHKVAKISKAKLKPRNNPPDEFDEHRMEMDSHADQCCVGDNVHIYYHWPGLLVEVGLFLSSLGCILSAPIVTAGVIYNNPASGRPILIIIHQAIYIKGLKHNLLCPMQL